MQDKINQLIDIAKERMKASRDPIHDLGHVERVVGYVKKFTEGTNLTDTQKQSLILAAYWHDIARSITKNPSFLWMAMIDDTLSALMLWRETIRCGLFGSSVGLSARIILCKSFGTGAIFTRILLSKKNRILLDIIQDADTVDMLHQERTIVMMKLAESSKLYYYGYKITMWWCVKTAEMHVKTENARKYLEDMLRKFIAWIKEKLIFQWHVQQFGIKWVKKTMRQAEELLQYIISPKYKSIRISI